VERWGEIKKNWGFTNGPLSCKEDKIVTYKHYVLIFFQNYKQKNKIKEKKLIQDATSMINTINILGAYNFL
jgi:hypothetical protein